MLGVMHKDAVWGAIQRETWDLNAAHSRDARAGSARAG